MDNGKNHILSDSKEAEAVAESKVGCEAMLRTYSGSASCYLNS
jgi:hypothetical protein